MSRTGKNTDGSVTNSLPSTSFTASRVNDTTFVIVEDDSYGEQPYIYAKLDPSEHVMILSDTGCDSPRDPSKRITHLRQFLEEYPVTANGGGPLNPGPTRRSYVILCSHCHYDHILGISQFTSPNTSSKCLIIASEAGKSFIEHDLPKHSLCSYLGVATPDYKVTHWAADKQRLVLAWPWRSPTETPTSNVAMVKDDVNDDFFIRGGSGKIDEISDMDLNITLLQTPGHTPDSMAWYDELERHLYVGDTFYQGEIIFPTDGDWIHYMASLSKLLSFVQQENGGTTKFNDEEEEDWMQLLPRVKLGCAHSTSSVDGIAIIEAVITLFERIIAGKVPVVKQQEIRGEMFYTWKEEEEDYEATTATAAGSRSGFGEDKFEFEFSVCGPLRLCREARMRFRL